MSIFEKTRDRSKAGNYERSTEYVNLPQRKPVFQQQISFQSAAESLSRLAIPQDKRCAACLARSASSLVAAAEIISNSVNNK
ncbi:hypothetical protein CEXT_597601 [Caerostris extrusa]|uniref:Uncharacterized protein n=1 Tax=Caerostris extrusa TaxID=172846 RepID=A0AAV4R353_CAEEX|nr:hypothetical protein CEXT_597601 [Caerostris extrusa]